MQVREAQVRLEPHSPSSSRGRESLVVVAPSTKPPRATGRWRAAAALILGIGACSNNGTHVPIATRVPTLTRESKALASSNPSRQAIVSPQPARTEQPEDARDATVDPEPWERLVDYPKSPGACLDLFGSECHEICVRYVATLLPAAASKSIACLRRAKRTHPNDSLVCTDPCTLTTCTGEAFQGTRGPGDKRCREEVRKAMLRDSSDVSYASEMVRQCQAYTSAMNKPGRDRFVTCALATVGMGYRICLWDPFVAPCGHDENHERHEIDIDLSP